MLTGRQIRDGRALLGLDRSKFALKVGGVTSGTVARAEKGDDEPSITFAQGDAIQRAFDRAGVSFANDSVRLQKRDP